MSDRKIYWRCFHCGEAFTKAQERWAREHFGAEQDALPACQMRLPGEHHLLTILRKQEAELNAYRSEDTDLWRSLYAMSADHAEALRREEERGYAKGLADSRSHPANISLDTLPFWPWLWANPFLDDPDEQEEATERRVRANYETAREPIPNQFALVHRTDIGRLVHALWRKRALQGSIAGRAPTLMCANHADRPSRTNLDGDELCQECADAWVRSEGDHAAWLEAEEREG